MPFPLFVSFFFKVCLFGLASCLLSFHSYAATNTVYLTFDDGPRKSTQEILDLLITEEVPGTFFLVGEHILMDPSRQKILEELQSSPWAQIANHSFSHGYGQRYSKFYSDPNGMLLDFQKNNELLGFVTPPFPTRLPGRIDWYFEQRHINSTHYPHPSKRPAPTSFTKLAEHGFVIYGWDVEWGKNEMEGILESPRRVAARVKRRFNTGVSVKPGKVVLLMHDHHFHGKYRIDKIQTLIHILRQEEYVFDFIENY